MTPARLEEVDEALGSEHPPDQRALMGIAHELLAEVKRLRETLRKISKRGEECYRECDLGRWEGTCGCGRAAGYDADEALVGEEPTPWATD